MVESCDLGYYKDDIALSLQKLTQGYQQKRYSCYQEQTRLPIRSEVRDLIAKLHRIMFFGYFEVMPKENIEIKIFNYFQEFTVNLENLVKLCLCQQDHKLSERHAKEIVRSFIQKIPTLKEKLELDIQAVLDGDPAAVSGDEVVLSYPGLLAVFVYRIANTLHRLGVPIIPKMLSSIAYERTAIDIHHGADIGDSFFIDHGAGVVVGETAKIGDRVRLYQGVTLGALSLSKNLVEKLKTSKRHPTIENDVIIYANATILGGDTVIGAGSMIGGNVWITSSVEAGSKVILKQPELVFLQQKHI